MKQAALDNKIHSFLARKERQYPELHRSVAELTREFQIEETPVPEDESERTRPQRRHHYSLHYAI